MSSTPEPISRSAGGFLPPPLPAGFFLSPLRLRAMRTAAFCLPRSIVRCAPVSPARVGHWTRGSHHRPRVAASTIKITGPTTGRTGHVQSPAPALPQGAGSIRRNTGARDIRFTLIVRSEIAFYYAKRSRWCRCSGVHSAVFVRTHESIHSLHEERRKV